MLKFTVRFAQQVPSGLPRSLEAALQRYGSSTFKAPVATVLDPNGKLSITLTYGNLFFSNIIIVVDLSGRSKTIPETDNSFIYNTRNNMVFKIL